MSKQVQLSLNPAVAADENRIRILAAKAAGSDPASDLKVRIIRRSVDARSRNIKVNLVVEVLSDDDAGKDEIAPFRYRNVRSSEEVLIIGAGPAGLFAALRLIELGLKPVIIERGKDVNSRKIDIARISREQKIDPDSNYCFGEGGAGTYSDGKLYTRSKKRGDNSRVLELLCLHGADRRILYEAHPHLGTDKLPGIIKRIRETIIASGGEILFEHRVEDIIIESGKFIGTTVTGNKTFKASTLIIATGHSARDFYAILSRRGVELEMKSFAMGVRVEHPQELIDRIQYHGNSRGEYLPAASYSIVRQVGGRGVYSFCMCPGGFIVPSATIQQEVVVNGMSPSGRNSPYANSGIVVEIRNEDLGPFSSFGVLAGIAFQEELEKAAWQNGGETQRAPAQRLSDFVNRKASGSIPKVSYFPGVTSSPMHDWLPPLIGNSLNEGFKQFGAAMRGFLTNEAVILGVESRTSSPVRIPRNPETLEHVRITGIYPCGEGSGYAGGIVSSAVDGMRVAEALAARKL